MQDADPTIIDVPRGDDEATVARRRAPEAPRARRVVVPRDEPEELQGAPALEPPASTPKRKEAPPSSRNEKAAEAERLAAMLAAYLEDE